MIHNIQGTRVETIVGVNVVQTNKGTTALPKLTRWETTCTGYSSHLRTRLPISSSLPLPAKWPNHATSPLNDSVMCNGTMNVAGTSGERMYRNGLEQETVAEKKIEFC